MDELEYIKKIESEAAGAIENARKDAEERFSRVKSMGEPKIKEMTDKANTEIDTDIRNAKKKAEKEANDILKGIDSELEEIEKKGSKNLDAATKMVIEEFLNIK